MKYRPEIDGLRTIAVLPVVLFHAGIGPFQGGFAGVDIFFVISGFLITSLIISDLETQRFSMLGFYERRARRILPALFLVLAVSSLLSWKMLYPLELNEYGQSVVSTVVFASNIFFWLKSDYFSTAAELKPLLHTWSLSVEEQYYVFFPPLFALLWKGAARHSRAILILVGISASSLGASLLFHTEWANAKFYLLPFRAWELLIGAICAVILTKWKVAANSLMAFIGICLIVAALLFASDHSWPSWQALLPTVGTALVILFATSSQGVGRLLASKPMVGIGLISYSLYLWHQPLFAFARIRLPDEPSAAIKLMLIATAVLLAWLTWKFVEQPFRLRRNSQFVISGRSLIGFSVVGSAVFLAAGLMIDAKDGWPTRKAPSGLTFAQIELDLAGARVATPPCDIDLAFRPAPQAPLQECIFPATEKSVGLRAILLGDSHATVLTAALVARLTSAGYETAVATFGGCIPFAGYRTVARDCNSANSAMLDYVKYADYDLIVLAFRPQRLISGEERIIPTSSISLIDPATFTQDLMKAGLKELLDTGSQVVVFEPVPEMGRDIGHLARNHFAFDAEYQNISFSKDLKDYIARTGPALDVLRRNENSNLKLIPTSEIFCAAEKMRCLGIEAGVALYIDDNHLSVFGVDKLIRNIDAALLPGPVPTSVGPEM